MFFTRDVWTEDPFARTIYAGFKYVVQPIGIVLIPGRNRFGRHKVGPIEVGVVPRSVPAEVSVRDRGSSGKQRERVHVLGANNREVSAVECRDLMHAEAFGDGHQAGVNAAKSQVGVSLNELGNPPPIRRRQSLDGQVPVGDRAVEPSLGGRSELTLDQPAGLGDDQRGCGQRAGVVLEQRLAALVIGISVVGRGENDVGVDEKGQLPNPSASMSSSSAARRPFVERPRLTKPSLRCGENRSVENFRRQRLGSNSELRRRLGDALRNPVIDFEGELRHGSSSVRRPEPRVIEVPDAALTCCQARHPIIPRPRRYRPQPGKRSGASPALPSHFHGKMRADVG